MKLTSRQFFTWWFGLGIPPFLLGTVYAGYLISTTWGVVTLLVVVAWGYNTFSTTCRRCQYYGSNRCGVPGLVVPYLFKRRSPFELSLGRVRLHYYLDIAMILYVNVVYAHFPWLFPVTAIGSLVAWWIVFKPKRFHGLLWRLREDTKAPVVVEKKIVLYPTHKPAPR